MLYRRSVAFHPVSEEDSLEVAAGLLALDESEEVEERKPQVSDVGQVSSEQVLPRLQRQRAG